MSLKEELSDVKNIHALKYQKLPFIAPHAAPSLIFP
jgi:hypothetical protein